MSAAALSARGVRVRLGGATVLHGVDLVAERGEWVCVVGPNGAGKSTLLRAVAGLVAADGQVALGGVGLASLTRRERARRVALVPQSPLTPPGMTVGEYVLLGRTPHLAPLAAEGPADRGAAWDALATLDLLGFATRRLDTLSGGERQRATLARALAQEAPLLLLDEPTAGLDLGHQSEVLEVVDRLRREAGVTVVSTLHDLTLAGQYADRLVLLDRGRVVVEGAPADVLTEDNLRRLYGPSVRVVRDGAHLVVVPVRAP